MSLESRSYGLVEGVVLVQQRGNGAPSLITQPVADLYRLLIQHLSPCSTRLEKAAAQRPHQSSSNSKSSRPDSCIALIHAAHLADAEA
ncbi:hypothetical protein OIE49_29495 [Streptomyces sp. NBC_01788]|uniref:hypothetical protein n=1 Tax=Streptomyces sp. NBC_01788 TaxID=2975940 RepID=UPI002DD9DF4F|nr:hypothetical protein [Streptomyces sp. NBC_01788]WSB29689.1 hypothetical protein OIE49_29495 [Streptomyces sp. NBC_01788]